MNLKPIVIFILISYQLYGQVAINSDKREKEIVEQCLAAMGGEEAWNNTKYIQWDFFGRRRLNWDKWNQELTVESISGSPQFKVWVNLTTKKGKAIIDNKWLTQPDSISFWMNKGYEYWVNDSYWLIMPFKLKDYGVQLKYLGFQKCSKMIDCEVLEVTFNQVGLTPENKYHVFFDLETHLVIEWSYFEKHSDLSPKMTTTWENYQKFGNILLATKRGKYNLDNISVR